MQYALLIFEDETVFAPDKAGPAAATAVMQEHIAFGQWLGAKRVGGQGLKGRATATTVRTAGGRKTVHDGPFAEAKEQLGGFYIVEAENLDDAIEIAKRVPVQPGGGIEIRPLLTM